MKTNKMLSVVLLSLALLSLVTFVRGAAADETEDKLRAAIAKLVPTAKVDAVAPSPVPGLYEVVVGPTLWYVTEDGQFLIDGDVWDIAKRVNLSESKLDEARAKAIAAIDEKDMIVFSPEHPKYKVTVFSDIDCGYCRKLHNQIKDYMDAGIAIRYLLYPRAGVHSASYQKAVSSWCADDRQAALTKAKSGQPIENKTCDNPIQQQMALGRSLGVTGTPTLVLESGQVIPGYVPPKKLSEMLEAKAGG